MTAMRRLLPIAIVCLLPLTAWAKDTYQFRPEPPNARGVDTAKINAMIPKLQVTGGTVATVTPAGGSLTLAGLTLEFPKGAVSKPTKVQWLGLRHPDMILGWLLEPRETKIAKPLVLHGAKVDLVFQLQQLGAYALLADRQSQQFHLVSLAVTSAPAKPLAKGKAAQPPKPTAKGASPKPNTGTKGTADHSAAHP